MQGTDSPEIIALVDKSLMQDRQVQFDLYSRYNKAMFNVCIRFIGEYTEAEDILQDAFLEAFKKLSSFRRESSSGAWLKKIVVNEPEEESGYNMDHSRKAVEALPDGYRAIFS